MTRCYFKHCYIHTHTHSIGPSGTAICVYHADNSGSADMSNGFNRGLFDIFRENVVNTDDSNMVEREPRLVECDPGGRDSDEAQFVNVAQNMGQIGEDPLVIFEGFQYVHLNCNFVPALIFNLYMSVLLFSV